MVQSPCRHNSARHAPSAAAALVAVFTFSAAAESICDSRVLRFNSSIADFSALMLRMTLATPTILPSASLIGDVETDT